MARKVLLFVDYVSLGQKVKLDTQEQKKLEELLLRSRVPEQCRDASRVDKSKSDSSSSGNNNLNSQLAQLYMKQFSVKESQTVPPKVQVGQEEDKHQSHIDKRATAESD